MMKDGTRRAADQSGNRALHGRKGEPRLHLRESLAQLSVPADAERQLEPGQGIADVDR